MAGSIVAVGGQDCSEHDEGAYTGQISAGMLKEAKCEYVILGHSERRLNNGETDEVIASKIKMAFSAGLGVIVCVGETASQRDSGNAQSIVLDQLLNAFDGSINNESKIHMFSKPDGKPIGEIGKLNIAIIKVCLKKWCKIKFDNNTGWINKKNLWGVYKNETINVPFYQPLINLTWKINLKN